MNYTGIDYHKRYSVACTLDAQGRKLSEARIEANSPEAFERYFKTLGGENTVVMEACWNWAVLYELLEQIGNVAEVVLSHPAKNRIIAESMHKNDRFDAHALATLLRGDFISRVHVPAKDAREKKNSLRQRLWLVRVRTMVRNRIHSLIDRHPRLPRPAFKDVFCNRGVHWMRTVALPAGERAMLDADLEVHTLLQAQIKALEKRIAAEHSGNAMSARLQTLPGVGVMLAPLISLEIDRIERFPSADKLCAYAGLIPTTRASGGKIAHGHILPFCNSWLRWGFVEASWVAVGCSDYFGGFYKTHRARGKGPNNAIVITARRMAKSPGKCSTRSAITTRKRPANTFPGRPELGLMV